MTAKIEDKDIYRENILLAFRYSELLPVDLVSINIEKMRLMKPYLEIAISI